VRWLRALRPRTFDRGLAALLAGPSIAEALVITDGGAAVAAALLIAVMAATLAVRRTHPLLGILVFFAAGIPMTIAIDDSESFFTPFAMVLIWAYALGALPDVRAAVRGLAIVIAGIAAISTAFSDTVVGDYIFPWGFATATWGAARTIQHRTRLSAELHEAALRAEEEREAQAVRAVADERRRIAREMHDVVAHSVSVMVVQAGGARRILERDPARAADAAKLIESTGRSALLEMRRLLGVLGTADEPAAMAPQPTLGELSALVERARAAGLPATLTVEGERRALPAGAEAAIYRVVQEALTNALKHAGSAPTDVVLRWGPETVEAIVADRGPLGGAPTQLPGGGHGIVGMRERVRVYGGELTAQPRPDGGFVVRARIPLEQAELVTA
jgi:signal transduction histidine kinase